MKLFNLFKTDVILFMKRTAKEIYEEKKRT